jgi:hypothetical protein
MKMKMNKEKQRWRKVGNDSAKKGGNVLDCEHFFGRYY